MLREFVNSQHFTSTTEIMDSMKELFSDVLQQVMEAELEEKLGYEKSERMAENAESGRVKNYRNGYSKKTVKTQLGEVDIKVPRDRNGEYEPQIIGKYSRNADGMEEKILALYSCGMSQRDIADQIKNLYDVEISDGLVSKIVEKITPEITAWQNRPLESVYPFIFMDAIHYKVKENHQYITKAAYIVLGIQLDGHKDILGVWIGEHESAKFWLSVACFCYLIQYPSEYLIYRFACKSMLEVVAQCREMRCLILQTISEKPTVCHIHLYLCRCSPQRGQSVQMLDQYHLYQHNRIYARSAIVFTIQILYHFIDLVKIHCCVYFSK